MSTGQNTQKIPNLASLLPATLPEPATADETAKIKRAETAREISPESTLDNSIRNTSGNVNTSGRQNSAVLPASALDTDEAYLAVAEKYRDGTATEAETEQLRKAVEEAARKAMPNTEILDEDGNLLTVYHGTSERFTEFDMSKGRTNMDINGSFFSPWELDAHGYGENVGKYYLNITNPANESTGYKALHRFQGQNKAGVKAREYLESLGYDGVNNEDEEFAAFDLIHKVLKRGIEIHREENYDRRGHATRSIAAPVVINGVRGNMLCLIKETGRNRYKCHRILMPDGSAFVFNVETKNESRGRTGKMTDTAAGESLPTTSVFNSSLTHNEAESQEQNSAKLSADAMDEVRDVQSRFDMTAEQRKNTRPDIDQTDVVFSEKNNTKTSAASPLSGSPAQQGSVRMTSKSVTAAAENLGSGGNIAQFSETVKKAITVFSDVVDAIKNKAPVRGSKKPISANSFEGVLVANGVLQRAGSTESSYRIDGNHTLRISGHSSNSNNFTTSGENLSVVLLTTNKTNDFITSENACRSCDYQW